MKRVLIISPHFPPINAPDMQRVRMSLPYYAENGWEAVVLCVDEAQVEGFRDPLLNKTIPENIEIHPVGAFSANWTRKFGLGSLSMRSFFQFRKKGNELLNKRKFDLVFFSTSLFHVVALGPYWKRKFGIPFVVDMQDPWRNDFYLEHPELPRPPKFRIAYTINKWLEARSMPHADGIIAVTQGYIDTLRKRYPALHQVKAQVMPFGSSKKDFELVKLENIEPVPLGSGEGIINVVYIGAFPVQAFLPVLKAFFLAFRREVSNQSKYHFHFIGTNYAPGQNRKPIEELARELQLSATVTETPERISYFTALATLQKADMLLILGSVEAQYNASKLYNYLLAGKPIFSVFHESALVTDVLRKSGAGLVAAFTGTESEEAFTNLVATLMPAFQSWHQHRPDEGKIKSFVYTAAQSAADQSAFFQGILNNN